MNIFRNLRRVVFTYVKLSIKFVYTFFTRRATFVRPLVFILIISWIFSGWPQIFDFPPGIQIAQATASTPTIAGTGADDAAVGTVTWTTPEEITVTGGGDDSVYATAALGKLAVSHYLKATNFGFTVPDGSTILGITVEIERKEGAAAAGGVKDSEVKLIDEAGTIRSTNKADTVNGWGSTEAIATYGGTSDTWGEAGGFWTTAKINDPDFGVVLSAVDYKVSGGGAAEDAFVDFVRITIEYGPPSITVDTIGTQTASMSIPSTSQYVGGAFTMVRSGGTANVTSITITENGTVDALNNLDNIKLQYDLDITSPYDCAGESFAAGDTQYGSTDIDGFSAANGTSAFTGSVAVSNTQAMCVYVILDVGSGASNGNTLEIEITNPSTDVVVSAGDVTPATAVAIFGATTLNLLPNVFQDHYRWRNDDGYEASGGGVDVGNIRPTDDVSNAMTITDGGCTAAWCVWDDSVTQPTAPGTASDYAQEGTDNDLAEVNMTTIDLGGGTSPSVVVWLYGTGAENVDLWTTDSINGQTTCATNAAVPDPGWVSGTCTFATALTQAALDGLTVTVRQNQLGGASTNTYYAVYAQVNKTQTAATWATGAEDQALSTLVKSTNIRLRFQIDNTGGVASNYNYRLEWAAQNGTCDTAYSGESYVAVPDVATTEHFDMTVDSDTYFSDGDPTTAQLTNAEVFTFVAGDQVESTSNQSGAITLAQNQYTEVEYVFQANANATDGGVYCFRVTNAGTALDSADVVAQVTLAGGGGGTITTDIVNASYVSVDSPTMAMNNATFSFSCQTVTGSFGTASQQIYVNNNGGANGGWTLTLAAQAVTNVWDSAGTDYDFNDPTDSGCTDGADTPDTVGGQMTVDASAATLAVGQCGSCTTNNVSKGSSAAFNQGTTDTITLLSATAASDDVGDWKLTGVSISQKIPAEQPATSDYDINMVLTVTAN